MCGYYIKKNVRPNQISVCKLVVLWAFVICVTEFGFSEKAILNVFPAIFSFNMKKDKNEILKRIDIILIIVQKWSVNYKVIILCPLGFVLLVILQPGVI